MWNDTERQQLKANNEAYKNEIIELSSQVAEL